MFPKNNSNSFEKENPYGETGPYILGWQFQVSLCVGGGGEGIVNVKFSNSPKFTKTCQHFCLMRTMCMCVLDTKGQPNFFACDGQNPWGGGGVIPPTPSPPPRINNASPERASPELYLQKTLVHFLGPTGPNEKAVRIMTRLLFIGYVGPKNTGESIRTPRKAPRSLLLSGSFTLKLVWHFLDSVEPEPNWDPPKEPSELTLGKCISSSVYPFSFLLLVQEKKPWIYLNSFYRYLK